MTAIADLSAIVNRLSGGNSGTPQHVFSFLSGRIQGAVPTAPVASTMHSLWRYDQSDGANGAIPGSAGVCNRSTIGALPVNNPGGGRQQWLLGIEGQLNAQAVVILYDRLLHNGGLSGTVTSAQTVGGTLTRYSTNATCVGNQIWVEVYTAIGATATTITASYTNQAGTAGRTTKPTAIGGAGKLAQSTIIILPLADGDTGVQAVASVTLAATTGTAGSFGVTIAHPLTIGNCGGAALFFTRDLIAGLPAGQEMLTDACLTWAVVPANTTIPSGLLAAHIIEV